MANVSVIKLKVRRGLDTERQLITLDMGEIGWTTDGKRLFVGDGTTPGGISAGMKFYSGSVPGAVLNDKNISNVQIGDLVYDTSTTRYCVLTGSTSLFNQPSAYATLGTYNVSLSVVNTTVNSSTGLNVTGLLSATYINTPNLTAASVRLYSGGPNSVLQSGYPTVFIGEVDDGTGGSAVGTLSGFNITYDESVNKLILSSNVNNQLSALITIDRISGLTVQGSISSTGTIYSTNLSASNTVTGRYLSATNGVYSNNAVNATNGFYSTSSFSGPYTDGIVVDYVTGQGRISVGANDAITFFNGGPAATATVTISTNGFTTFSDSVSVNKNLYASGNVFGGTNINILNGTSYTIQLSDNGGTIASTNNTTGLTALVNSTGYPVGFQTAVIQLSTARVAVSGTGFNVNQANSFYKTTKQYSAATLLYTGSIGGWVLFGDVSV